jgi:RNase P/RNase MRP subunit p29
MPLYSTVADDETQCAALQVTRALCPTHVGIEGICLMETKSTLQIISKDNRLRYPA